MKVITRPRPPDPSPARGAGAVARTLRSWLWPGWRGVGSLALHAVAALALAVAVGLLVSVVEPGSTPDEIDEAVGVGLAAFGMFAVVVWAMLPHLLPRRSR